MGNCEIPDSETSATNQPVPETRQCKICGEVKPLTVKYWKIEPRCIGGFCPRCRKCQSIENSKRQNKKYREDEAWRTSIIKKTGEYYRNKFDSDAEYRENKRKRGVDYWRKIKLDVLKYYSNGSLKCSCCGEDTVEFLSIDHINGSGNKHRGELKSKAGTRFYKWLRDNGFPEGYRVLCYNCNSCLGFYGYCPHESPNLAGSLRRVKSS